jgi:hypothetical protein
MPAFSLRSCPAGSRPRLVRHRRGAAGSDASRRVYLGYKVWIDRSAGLIMMGLGLRLIGIAGRN